MSSYNTHSVFTGCLKSSFLRIFIIHACIISSVQYPHVKTECSITTIEFWRYLATMIVKVQVLRVHCYALFIKWLSPSQFTLCLYLPFLYTKYLYVQNFYDGLLPIRASTLSPMPWLPHKYLPAFGGSKLPAGASHKILIENQLFLSSISISPPLLGYPKFLQQPPVRSQSYLRADHSVSGKPDLNTEFARFTLTSSLYKR